MLSSVQVSANFNLHRDSTLISALALVSLWSPIFPKSALSGQGPHSVLFTDVSGKPGTVPAL